MSQRIPVRRPDTITRANVTLAAVRLTGLGAEPTAELVAKEIMNHPARRHVARTESLLKPRGA